MMKWGQEWIERLGGKVGTVVLFHFEDFLPLPLMPLRVRSDGIEGHWHPRIGWPNRAAAAGAAGIL